MAANIIVIRFVVVGCAAVSVLFCYVILQYEDFQFGRFIQKHFHAVGDNQQGIRQLSNFCSSYLASSRGWSEYNFSQVPTSILQNDTGDSGQNSRLYKISQLIQNQATELANNSSYFNISGKSDYESCTLLRTIPSEVCDEDCEKFRAMMTRWPDDKPKSVIYFLTQFSRIDQLKTSLTLLEKHFNEEFRYPVIIFYDEDAFTNATVRNNISSSTTGNYTFFQRVNFTLPPNINPDKVSKHYCNIAPVGYRHMCRFHAKQVYELPIFSDLDLGYLWRLDDDSLITHPVKYDVFKFMKTHGFLYGYSLLQDDYLDCVEGLWEAACNFVQYEMTRVEFFYRWLRPRVYYNNFEISAFALWRSCKYRMFVDYIDRLGGIYYMRWGDAPIKTIAVSLFVPESKVHRFMDVGYKHLSLSNVPRV